MKKLLIISFLILCSSYSYSQLANQNTYLLKNIDVAGRSYSALWGYTAPDGREYAILGYNRGTSFIDITDSANIREVDTLSGLTSSWREMKTYSHYAYIVSEATNSKLQIVDLQYLPDSVSLVATWSYAGYTKTHSISQSGNYLYLNGGNAASSVGGVAVVDVSNPVSPVKMGEWNTEYVHDCRVQNDTIWAANVYTGKMSIINASNKSSLQFVRNWQAYPQSAVSTHNCAFPVTRDYIYTTNEVSSPAGKLNVWDIRDLNNITFVRDWQPTGITTAIVHNIETYGNYAVIAHYTAGIRILNISNPSNPVEVAWYDTYPSSNSTNFSGCWGVYKFSSGKIIGSDISNGLFVIKTNFFMTEIPKEINSNAKDYKLNQNFPNPFNPVTNIKFSLKENSKVSLKIYSIQGKEVADIINDRRDGGDYEIIFDAGKYNLNSGVYFYTLNVNNRSNSFSETKKMILTK
ncbi:MAG: choice-of-anchor B family protein [Ignavibacteria bacterium]|nr:choice-of-anchor B family protein [Ignavibacteria bacterium]